MNIILLGAPGTGKGTIASTIAREHGFTHLSTGDMLREEVHKGTHLGIKVKSILDAGQLVPDEVVNALIKKYIKSDNVFDGYPRTLAQAKELDSFVLIDTVILFDMSEDAIVERLAGRRVCFQCKAVYHVKTILPKKDGRCDKCAGQLIQRDDDKPEVIRKRFKVYTDQTAPLIDYYHRRGILKNVDASRMPDDVYRKVRALLASK